MALDLVSCRVQFCKIHGNSGFSSGFVDITYFFFSLSDFEIIK